MPDRTPRVEHPSQLLRAPKYATLPDLSAPTRGGKIAVLASEMGKPFLPHQQYIADVATEMNPPGHPFLFRRRLIVVALPRQTGKTTMQRPVFVERCMSRPRSSVFMTAQLGKYSSARWNDLVSDLQTSPLFSSWVKIVRGKGSERCTFPNQSFISPFAPGPDALHGETPPAVSVDEGWAFTAEQGANLMRAIRPAQQTLWDRQLWVFSAAGTPESEWWDEMCEAGRASVLDPLSDMGYFEWAIADDADPYDEDSWQFHPGLDGLITIDTLREEAKPERNSHGDWLRGYMNRSTKVRDATVLDLGAWDRLYGAQDKPDARSVVYAYDVAVDRSQASVWASWRDASGRKNLRTYLVAEGDGWLVEAMGALHRQGAQVLAADDGGPARVITDRLTRERVPVTVLGGREAATAWASFKADATEPNLVHDGSTSLRSALEVAVERRAGDLTVLSRSMSLGPIDSLVAAMTAAWHADRITARKQLF